MSLLEQVKQLIIDIENNKKGDENKNTYYDISILKDCKVILQSLVYFNELEQAAETLNQVVAKLRTVKEEMNKNVITE